MRRPTRTTETSEAEGEHTEVRARQPGAHEAPARYALDEKLARAREAFLHLDPDDPRARLLQVALLRRDEVLIDALLRRLEQG